MVGIIAVDIVKNLRLVKDRIAGAALSVGRDPGDISIVAVSKYATAPAVATLVEAGHRDFGESRVQDGLAKVEVLANPQLRWHLIGRVQTNKIKYISPFHLVHSLDRWDLAVKMSNYARRKDLEFRCLAQVNVANDSAKAGVGLDEVEDFIARVAKLEGLRIRGLMTITALDAEPGETEAWFESLAEKYQQLKKWCPEKVSMEWLSMGMSADYELAVKAGANLVRVGSAIFVGGGE